MSTPADLSAKPCVDAIVAGDGYEVFGLARAGRALCGTGGWQA